MVGRGRDQSNSLLACPQGRDVVRNLRPGKLPSLAGLGALGHLDLELLRRHEEFRRHAEPTTSDLVNVRVGRVTVLQSREVGECGAAAVLVDVRQV